MNITHTHTVTRWRLHLLAFLLSMLALPLSAEESGDSTFIFRFFTGKNEFYSPGLQNGPELRRMYECVDRCRDLIKSGDIMLYVNGYSNSAKKSEKENLRIARVRSLRVKSELITNKGLREQNFITKNHAGEGNFVTVQFSVPKDRLKSVAYHEVHPEPPTLPEAEEIPVPPVEEEIEIPEIAPIDTLSVPEPEPECPVVVEAEEAPEIDSSEAEEIIGSVKSERPDSRWALKTNLLYYAILMPNLEVEWKFSDRWSAALEGNIAWYGKENPHKIYKIATVIPEVRYWPIERSRWHGMYVGVFGGLGMYDWSKGGDGHEGEGFMAGASVGYMWPIGKHLSLDAGLGVGYMRLRDKKYRPLDGHFLYQLTKHINYFGPLKLKLSLTWRIPKY